MGKNSLSIYLRRRRNFLLQIANHGHFVGVQRLARHPNLFWHIHGCTGQDLDSHRSVSVQAKQMILFSSIEDVDNGRQVRFDNVAINDDFVSIQSDLLIRMLFQQLLDIIR